MDKVFGPFKYSLTPEEAEECVNKFPFHPEREPKFQSRFSLGMYMIILAVMVDGSSYNLIFPRFTAEFSACALITMILQNLCNALDVRFHLKALKKTHGLADHLHERTITISNGTFARTMNGLTHIAEWRKVEGVLLLPGMAVFQIIDVGNVAIPKRVFEKEKDYVDLVDFARSRMRAESPYKL